LVVKPKQQDKPELCSAFSHNTQALFDNQPLIFSALAILF